MSFLQSADIVGTVDRLIDTDLHEFKVYSPVSTVQNRILGTVEEGFIMAMRKPCSSVGFLCFHPVEWMIGEGVEQIQTSRMCCHGHALVVSKS